MKKLLIMVLAMLLISSSVAFAGCGSCGAGAHKSGEAASHMHGEEMSEQAGSKKAAEAGSYKAEGTAGAMKEGKAVEGTNLSTKQKAQEASSY